MTNETPNVQETNSDRYEPGFGWTPYAEQINGRFAMIGFVGLLILEILTGKGLLTWMGIL
ncbi:CAB/ELIP/HLIP-related protein [Geitlerinema sp. FC II]|uniref:chlorophyll a/b-binding protein n=1 Tax=Baaleninema TaxID=2862346 RepID=UPI00034634CF|nr:chlorophyll a/b-binding protein [Baaleninema simplex]MDC0836005.1 chlorophyll a/b-binding protein [Geitlerinema sp. CS-897]PPT05269.1 CAB/ELIP/HLIP-related protein [Geitlerinema sp. FC II]